jgi:hypothetical protein
MIEIRCIVTSWPGGGQYCQIISQQREICVRMGELTGIAVEPKGSSRSHGERAIAERQVSKCSVS